MWGILLRLKYSSQGPRQFFGKKKAVRSGTTIKCILDFACSRPTAMCSVWVGG